jgi:hypothetical protein
MIDKRFDAKELTPEELILCEKEASLQFWSLNYNMTYEVSKHKSVLTEINRLLDFEKLAKKWSIRKSRHINYL